MENTVFLPEYEFLPEIETTAKALYQLGIDMDYADYAEYRDGDLAELRKALEIIKSNAQSNHYLAFWKTFAMCLESITNTTVINDAIFGKEGDEA